MIRSGFHLFSIVGLLMLVSSCGGGSEDSNDSASLFVNAGADRSISEGVPVSLTAESRGGTGALTWRWIASPALTILHEDNTVPDASFVAPTVSTARDYTLTVTVTDTTGQTASDSTVITVQPDNAAPVADIALSAWEGLAAGLYPAGVTLTLDGSGSSDADASNPASQIADYLWTQTEGIDVLQDVMTEQSQLVITTPIASARQNLAFTLRVTDEEGATDETSIAITIQSASETLPVIDAGVSQAVFSGEPVILEGTAYTTIPSANPLAIRWEADSAIQSANSLSTYAIAPLVDAYSERVFTLTVTDANGNQVTDSLRAAVRPYPVSLMNDTGVSVQATDTALTPNQQNLWPGQDAQRGSDVIHQAGLLEKAGEGDAGFDFTKLNSNGDEQDAASGTFSCVRDNVTGLVWEVKTTTAGLHSADNTFSWYQSEDNGGFEGDINGAAASCTLTNCNTEAYVAQVNAQGLCGFYDWRLPTHRELMSLVHFGITDAAMIDSDFYPNTGDIAAQPLWYWTTNPGADGVQDDSAQNAWAIDFASGVDNFLNKSEAARVRLVRAGREGL
ncbi:DUF1566 domain-containing protein [Alteromonas sp. H39]|uniref:Lcl C-terminal domain-containing protein n=1 Tax=Alteromonas sp. H39 TaxID=3389876 RepID=UPI0039DF346B